MMPNDGIEQRKFSGSASCRRPTRTLAEVHFLLLRREKSSVGGRNSRRVRKDPMERAFRGINSRRFSFSTFSTRKELFRGDELSPIFIFYFFDAKRALSGGDFHFPLFRHEKSSFDAKRALGGLERVPKGI